MSGSKVASTPPKTNSIVEPQQRFGDGNSVDARAVGRFEILQPATVASELQLRVSPGHRRIVDDDHVVRRAADRDHLVNELVSRTSDDELWHIVDLNLSR